jgi:hypothetical protein
VNKADSEVWVLAATGQLGDAVYWEPGFEVVERVRRLLCLLEEIGQKKVDWSYLLQGLPNLGDIETMSFPPLYTEDAFDEIDGFLTVTEEPEDDDRPGMSFSRIEVYIDRENRERLIEQFETLSDRLENFKPLGPYI